VPTFFCLTPGVFVIRKIWHSMSASKKKPANATRCTLAWMLLSVHLENDLSIVHARPFHSALRVLAVQVVAAEYAGEGLQRGQRRREDERASS
jgi:hypothetical protein